MKFILHFGLGYVIGSTLTLYGIEYLYSKGLI